MSSLNDRLVAPCAEFDARRNLSIPDISALINRLLVFETYFLQSTRLKEFPPLVLALGIENVVLLLDSGALKVYLNPSQFGQVEQPSSEFEFRQKPPLPKLSFSFAGIRVPHYNDYVLRCLKEVHSDLSDEYSRKTLMHLEGAILRARTPVPENSGIAAHDAFISDLRGNSPAFKTAIAIHLRETRGLQISPAEISLNIIPIDETDFRAESNLDSFGFSLDESHFALERSLLAAGAVNLRIEDMRILDALSGSIDDEQPLFSEKYNFLRANLSPGDREKTLDRVAAVRGLPSFNFNAPTKTFAMEHFLKVRRSEECAEFRAWLKQATSMDDEQISHVGSLRARLAPYMHGTTGKGIRLAVSIGVGFIPKYGVVLAATFGALDYFVLDKILPISGPTAFLTRSYRSLFDATRPDSSADREPPSRDVGVLPRGKSPDDKLHGDSASK